MFSGLYDGWVYRDIHQDSERSAPKSPIEAKIQHALGTEGRRIPTLPGSKGIRISRAMRRPTEQTGVHTRARIWRRRDTCGSDSFARKSGSGGQRGKWKRPAGLGEKGLVSVYPVPDRQRAHKTSGYSEFRIGKANTDRCKCGRRSAQSWNRCAHRGQSGESGFFFNSLLACGIYLWRGQGPNLQGLEPPPSKKKKIRNYIHGPPPGGLSPPRGPSPQTTNEKIFF